MRADDAYASWEARCGQTPSDIADACRWRRRIAQSETLLNDVLQKKINVIKYLKTKVSAVDEKIAEFCSRIIDEFMMCK